MGAGIYKCDGNSYKASITARREELGVRLAKMWEEMKIIEAVNAIDIVESLDAVETIYA